MTRWMGVLFAGVVAAACGHEVTTGSARNDWTTPTGYANATNPRYIDPMAGVQPTHNRSTFAKREAPPLQEPPPAEATPPDAVPPPVESAPPHQTLPRDSEQPPPYVDPIQPQP